jgi:hypothetical protein
MLWPYCCNYNRYKKIIMDNNYSNEGHDRDSINMKEYYDVEYWTSKFGINREKLQEAVDAVGISAEEVGKYLK